MAASSPTASPSAPRACARPMRSACSSVVTPANARFPEIPAWATPRCTAPPASARVRSLPGEKGCSAERRDRALVAEALTALVVGEGSPGGGAVMASGAESGREGVGRVEPRAKAVHRRPQVSRRGAGDAFQRGLQEEQPVAEAHAEVGVVAREAEAPRLGRIGLVREVGAAED